MKTNSRTVYSTETGRLCNICAKSLELCVCRNSKTVKGDGKVRVSRETKGRKGKGVTLVTGLALDETELKILAKKLKQLCGCGGAVKDGVIEIQGENRDQILKELVSLGFDAKKSGG